ncbi:MAG: TauD/TfdA family dioxygenase [Gammaproteobacteria bacterium]|nr:TauD/TfdA family dioxygenase [Gammaproteobacteria bacterium]
MDIKPLDATFGAVITGVDLTSLSNHEFESIYATWLDHALLIFPEQYLDRDQQIAFARRFGELEFDIAPISNVKKDGSLRADDDSDDVMKIIKGNMGWHADSTYMPIQAKGAVFTAHEVPADGGETGWADMRAAFDALDETERRQVEKFSAYHSLHYSQSKLGHAHNESSEYSGYGFHNEDPPLRPLVKTHPETGRKSLLIGRHAYGIPGLSSEASERLLDELIEFACQTPRTYYHTWSPGEAVIWDNRCLLHRACPWDLNEPRVMYHSRIKGDEASEFAASG